MSSPIIIERVVEVTARYRIEDVRWSLAGREQTSRVIVCSKCHLRSFNPNDVKFRYCGKCNEFMGGMVPTTAQAPGTGLQLGLYTLDDERRPVLWFALDPDVARESDDFTERVTEWSRWIEAHQKETSVGLTEGAGFVVVTSFLGINLAVAGPPGLFETIVYYVGGATKGPWRCDTWPEAEENHTRVVAELGAPVA